MDRYLRLLSLRWTVPLLVVGLAGFLWLSIRTVSPSSGNAVSATRAAAPRAAPLAAIPKPPSAAPLAAGEEGEWLPSLVDDTRTVLTGFSLVMGQPEGASVTTVSATAGPQLFPPGPEQTAGGGQPARWYPETPPQRSSSAEEAPRLLIVPPDACGHRSQSLELAAREADLHSRRGFELAGRGAYFSARAEFIMALRLLSQALDAQRNTRLHSHSLAAGLTALDEAEDFLPPGSGLEAHLDLAGIIGAHQTPVLHHATTDGLTAMEALQCYFTYAQEQLAMAVDREVAGTMALYGLGKLHKVLSEQRSSAVPAARPKAMVFYQAALLVYPQNYMASNDLGVLLAQAGRYEDARMALEHSVALHQGSTGWHNLAVVYQSLGQSELAQRAERLSQVARQKERTELAHTAPSSPYPVTWVEPQVFAQESGQTHLAGQPAPARTPAAPHAAPGINAAPSAAHSNVARFPFSSPYDKK